MNTTRFPGKASVRPAASHNPWIRRYHPLSERAPILVCLPHAGGAAGYFRPLSSALFPDVSTLAVQYPGRQDRYREKPLTDLSALADGIHEALVHEVGEHLPATVLFGHSMGALLAFEVALRFERSGGRAPGALILSGRRPPSRPSPRSARPMTDDELIAELADLGGTSADALSDPDVVGMFLPSLRADYLALRGYRSAPSARVSCPIAVVTGDRDPLCNVDDARAWAVHTGESHEVHVLPGGHFYLSDEKSGFTSLMSELVPKIIASS